MSINIRKNTDIKNIIIQHTGHVLNATVESINYDLFQLGSHGITYYDILINKNGSVYLTSRWTRYQKGHLEVNVDISKIFEYKDHFYLDIIPKYYTGNSLSIGIVGNYDIERPNSLVFSVLTDLLSKIIENFNIDLYTSLLYYSEIYNTTSPGVFFFDKYYLIKESMKKARIDRSIYKHFVSTGDLYRLMEDNIIIRLLEDGSSRLLESSL